MCFIPQSDYGCISTPSAFPLTDVAAVNACKITCLDSKVNALNMSHLLAFMHNCLLVFRCSSNLSFSLLQLLKHQQIIEELMEENKKLRRILVEDLKVPSDKLQASNEDRTKHTDPCSDCIDSQRREKK